MILQRTLKKDKDLIALNDLIDREWVNIKNVDDNAAKADNAREKLLQELIELHHIENGLLNSRLSSFLVATAFLIGAFAQFRELGKQWLPATDVCVAGLLISCAMLYVLARTSNALRWYGKAIRVVEEKVRPNPLQRTQNIRHNLKGGGVGNFPVSIVMGYLVPLMTILVWLCLGFWLYLSRPVNTTSQTVLFINTIKTTTAMTTTTISGPRSG